MRNLVTILAFFAFVNSQLAQIEIIPTNTTKNLVDLSVIKSNIMVVGREDYLSKSIDACNSLTLCNLPGPIGYQNHLCRIDTNTSYLLSESLPSYDSKIYKSTDGGNTWSLKLNAPSVHLGEVCFFDSLEGIAFDSYTFYKKVYRTKDGGSSWTSTVTIYFPDNVLVSEMFGDSIIALGSASGPDGAIYISHDRANTWISGAAPLPDSQPTGIFFLNKDTVFGISCCGNKAPVYPAAYFTKTFDGGLTWKNIPVDNYSAYADLFFKSAKEGYVVGMNAQQEGVILKTTDLGETWETFNTHLKTQFLAIKFLNDSIALISGSNGVLLKWNTRQTIFTGIKEYSFASGLKIFPNPVQEKLSFEFDNNLPQEIVLEISNTLGQVVYSKTNADLNEELEIGFLANGLYYLQLKNNISKKVFKFVKE